MICDHLQEKQQLNISWYVLIQKQAKKIDLVILYVFLHYLHVEKILVKT